MVAMSYFCRQNVSQISLEIVANCSHPSEILALALFMKIKFSQISEFTVFTPPPPPPPTHTHTHRPYYHQLCNSNEFHIKNFTPFLAHLSTNWVFIISQCFEWQLLLYYWVNFNQTSQEFFLGDLHKWICIRLFMQYEHDFLSIPKHKSHFSRIVNR